MGRYRDTGWLVWGDSRCLKESLGTLQAPHPLTAEAQKSEPLPSPVPKPRIGDGGLLVEWSVASYGQMDQSWGLSCPTTAQLPPGRN